GVVWRRHPGAVGTAERGVVLHRGRSALDRCAGEDPAQQRRRARRAKAAVSTLNERRRAVRAVRRLRGWSAVSGEQSVCRSADDHDDPELEGQAVGKPLATVTKQSLEPRGFGEIELRNTSPARSILPL